MEEITQVKTLAEAFFEIIVAFAKGVASTFNSTIPDLFNNFADIEGMPAIIVTLSEAVANLIGGIPLIGEAKILTIIFGGVVTTLILIIIIKFLVDLLGGGD